MLLQLLKRRGVKATSDQKGAADRSMGMHVIDVNRTVKVREIIPPLSFQYASRPTPVFVPPW